MEQHHHYIANELEYTTDFEALIHLRSSSSLSLNVCGTCLFTVGDRAFPVAAARTCNSLTQRVMSAPSVSVFRGCLKAFLLRRFFPWLLLQLTATLAVPAEWQFNSCHIFRRLTRYFYFITSLLSL